MYAYIKGELTEIDIDYIVIETGGIGYRIFIPAKTFEYLPPVGEGLKVYTYLHLLAILSTLDADDLRFAVLSGDAKAISKAPGIGAKTAQRVILELKDKMSLEDAFEKKTMHVEERAQSAGGASVKNDAVMALTALGYSSTESLKAVSKVTITEDMDVEDVLKAALKFLL